MIKTALKSLAIAVVMAVAGFAILWAPSGLTPVRMAHGQPVAAEYRLPEPTAGQPVSHSTAPAETPRVVKIGEFLAISQNWPQPVRMFVLRDDTPAGDAFREWNAVAVSDGVRSYADYRAWLAADGRGHAEIMLSRVVGEHWTLEARDDVSLDLPSAPPAIKGDLVDWSDRIDMRSPDFKLQLLEQLVPDCWQSQLAMDARFEQFAENLYRRTIQKGKSLGWTVRSSLECKDFWADAMPAAVWEAQVFIERHYAVSLDLSPASGWKPITKLPDPY